VSTTLPVNETSLILAYQSDGEYRPIRTISGDWSKAVEISRICGVQKLYPFGTCRLFNYLHYIHAEYSIFSNSVRLSVCLSRMSKRSNVSSKTFIAFCSNAGQCILFSGNSEAVISV